MSVSAVIVGPRTVCARNNSVRNAAIVLADSSGGNILILTGHDESLSVPGGQIDGSDKGPFAAMKREFREEVGQDLPRILNIDHFVYNGHTVIYFGTTNESIYFTPNREKKSATYMSWQELADGIPRHMFSPGTYDSLKDAISRMRSANILT